MNLLIFNALSWEQRKLGDISDSYSGGTPTAGKAEYYGGKIPFIRSAEVNSDTTELFLTEEGLKNSSAKMVNKGDILYALYGATSGEVGLARLDGAINQAILDIKPHENFDASFIMQWLRKSKESIIGTYLQGGQGNLSGTIVTSLMVDCPNYAEQQKIGGFFSDLDNLITLHQSKAESWKNKENQLSTISWEQRKLGDIASSFAYGLNAAAKEFDGKHKYLRITDIDDVSRVFQDDNLTSPDADIDAADDYRLEEGDLLFARTGASVGKSYIYKESDGLVYYAGFLIRAKIRPEYDAEFVFQNTLTSTYEKYIKTTSQRSGQPGVNAKEYAEYSMSLPEYAEQVKIGMFLRKIDDAITLHHRKLNRTQICINRSFIYGSF